MPPVDCIVQFLDQGEAGRAFEEARLRQSLVLLADPVSGLREALRYEVLMAVCEEVAGHCKSARSRYLRVLSLYPAETDEDMKARGQILAKLLSQTAAGDPWSPGS